MSADTMAPVARTTPVGSNVAALLPILRCPVTGSRLMTTPEGDLVTEDGARAYPVIDGVPVLMDRERSLFDPVPVSPADAGQDRRSRRNQRLRTTAWTVGRRLVPSISLNVRADDNFRHLGRLLSPTESDGATSPRRVLIVGGAVEGHGVKELLALPHVETVDTDVVIGPRTRVLADAHDLPFADGSFDAVVVQAVLGNVADPGRAVAEIHRVLMSDGFVYAETSFLQGVYLGPYDFTRYTHVGLRRLFRDFDEISSGVQCGPGMMLAWAVVWFLVALGGRRRAARLGLRAVAPFFVFWLKYLDRYLVDKPGAYDAASGTFFLGRRRTSPVPDREILRSYRGAVKTEWLDEQRDATP
jgi:uncharacterized protein YbaR (Trm112 family)/SAM-dependent methyltransferase